MGNTGNRHLDRMIDLLKLKFTLLQDIHAITREQTVLMSEQGMDGLGRLIALKQDKINEIDGIDEEFLTNMQKLKKGLNVASLEEIKTNETKRLEDLNMLTDRIIKLSNEISGIEKENSVKAKALLNSLGEKARKANRGRTVTLAYNQGYLNTNSYFIDKKK